MPDLDSILEHVSSSLHAEILEVSLGHFVELHPSHIALQTHELDGLLNLSIRNPLQFHIVAFRRTRSVEMQEKTLKLLLDRGARPLRGQ